MTGSGVDRSLNAYARLAGFMFLFVDVAYMSGLASPSPVMLARFRLMKFQ